jgi:hypothetical protein
METVKQLNLEITQVQLGYPTKKGAIELKSIAPFGSPAILGKIAYLNINRAC